MAVLHYHPVTCVSEPLDLVGECREVEEILDEAGLSDKFFVYPGVVLKRKGQEIRIFVTPKPHDDEETKAKIEDALWDTKFVLDRCSM